MKKHDEVHASAVALIRSKPHESRFFTPLDFILDEHMRQRALCGLLEEVASSGRCAETTAGAIVEFLKTDFGLHVLDEEEDLFPLLLEKVDDDGHLLDVIEQLRAEHAHDRNIARRVSDGLAPGSDRALPAEFLRLLHSFAASERRHLIVENAIVMPLARASLSEADLSTLGAHMAARRGILLAGDQNAV